MDPLIPSKILPAIGNECRRGVLTAFFAACKRGEDTASTVPSIGEIDECRLGSACFPRIAQADRAVEHRGGFGGVVVDAEVADALELEHRACGA